MTFDAFFLIHHGQWTGADDPFLLAGLEAHETQSLKSIDFTVMKNGFENRPLQVDEAAGSLRIRLAICIELTG